MTMQLRCGCAGMNLPANKSNNYNSHGRPVLYTTHVCINHKATFNFPPECYYSDAQVLIFECGCSFGSFTHDDFSKKIEIYRYHCQMHANTTTKLVALQGKISQIQSKIMSEAEQKIEEHTKELAKEMRLILENEHNTDPFINDQFAFNDY